MSLTLKGIGKLIEEQKKLGLSTEEIAKNVSIVFEGPLRCLGIWPESAVLGLLDNYFSNPLQNKLSKCGRALMKQESTNNFFEREQAFVENLLIRDLSKYLKTNNLSSKILGSNEHNLTLAIRASEKIAISNFIAAWLTQFEYPIAMPIVVEDLNSRTLQKPKPDNLNPNLKKEKIISMFL